MPWRHDRVDPSVVPSWRICAAIPLPSPEPTGNHPCRHAPASTVRISGGERGNQTAHAPILGPPRPAICDADHRIAGIIRNFRHVLNHQADSFQFRVKKNTRSEEHTSEIQSLMSISYAV